MRLLSFVGTRPETIKMLAFSRAAAQVKDLEFHVLHTGQNFGANMADCFWKELDIPVSRVNSGVNRDSVGKIAQTLLDFIVDSVRELKPDAIISNTDTDSAFYTALAGSKAKVPVAHIEGGIRCEARLNPEEVNRRLADHLSTWVFTISDDDTKSLLQEGFRKDEVFMLGDITLDALNFVLKENKIIVQSGDYDLLTIHRQENANDPKRLAAILEGVAQAGFKTVFPVHPRTRGTLELPELQAILRRTKNIELLEPQSYVNMVRTAAGCRKIISDSGGLRREGYMLGKPVISLVWFVWFKEMNRRGFELSVDADTKAIAKAIRGFAPTKKRPPLFGDGKAGLHILRKISALTRNHKG